MAYVEEKLTKELPTHPSFNEDVGDGNIYCNHNKLDNSSSSEETTNNGNLNLISSLSDCRSI